MSKFLKGFSFEKLVTTVFMALIGLVAAVSLIDLAIRVVEEIISPEGFLHEIDRLPDVLSLFLWVLITIELLDSVRSYVKEHAFHIESVVSVAVIAMARKVIVLDIHELEGIKIAALAAIIIALSVSYYLVRKSHHLIN